MIFKVAMIFVYQLVNLSSISLFITFYITYKAFVIKKTYI